MAIDYALSEPFLDLNCGAFSSSLLDSELFGHERGAFTGAHARRAGKLEAADGGDIFLDEVDSLSLEAQSKLLRALETKEVTPLGGNSVKRLTFRVIAATNADLEEKIRAGKFRQDLFARLNGICIEIQPLVKRPDDIPVLIEHFIAKSARPGIKVAAESMSLLKNYHWPENVRQLRQVLMAMIALADGDVLVASDVPEKLRKTGAVLGRASRANGAADGNLEISLSLEAGLDFTMQVTERSYIDAVTKSFKGPVSQTELAKALKVPRSTLQRRLQELSSLKSESGSSHEDHLI